MFFIIVARVLDNHVFSFADRSRGGVLMFLGDLIRRNRKYFPDKAAFIFEGKRFTWTEGRTLDDIAALADKYPLPIADDSEGCAICHL